MEGANNERKFTTSVVGGVGAVMLLLGLIVGAFLGPKLPLAEPPSAPPDCITKGTCAVAVAVPRVETLSRDVVIDLYKKEFGETHNHIVPCHQRQGGAWIASDCSVEVPLKNIEAEFIGGFPIAMWRVIAVYNLDGDTIHSTVVVSPDEADAQYLRKDDLVSLEFVYDFDGAAWKGAAPFSTYRFWYYDLGSANWSIVPPFFGEQSYD